MTKIKKLLQKENVTYILLLCIASIFVCLPLLNQKLNISYDDGIQHIARLIGTYQSLQEKQVFPVIMSKFCNGFGYSWNLFYSPLTAYIPLVFKLIGASFVNCIKLFLFVITFLSGITMYFFTKEITKNKKIAVIAGIFYLFAPYRFTDMYVRNALAELTSFAFLPMVFMGLYGVLQGKAKSKYSLIIGASLLVLTHSIISIYVAILCFIYLLVQSKKLKNKKIFRNIIFSLVFILLMTSFFWVPLWEHKVGANYEVFKPGRMERTEVLIAFKLSFSELFLTLPGNIHIYEIGWISILLLIASPIAIQRLRKKWKHTSFYRFYLFALASGIVCSIMTLKIFPFESLPAILKMLQFSFRLLEFSSFFFAFVVAVNFHMLIRKIKNIDICVVLIVLMLFTTTYIHHLPYINHIDENRLWDSVRVTKETGRVHAGCASFEYLPSKAFEHRSYLETREDCIYVLEGNAQIRMQNKENTNLKSIVSTEGETKLELPYLYYLGYEVTLEQQDKKEVLQPYETENGFVGVTLENVEEGILEVHYTGTFLMKVSYTASILGLVLFVLLFVLQLRKNKLH